jgi:membrane protease YdiL (CAAX protease family)
VGGRADALKLVAIAILWLALARFLPDFLWRALPRTLLDSLSLPAYSMLCQVATTVLGLGAARLALVRTRAALGLERPSLWHVSAAMLLAPAVFVMASYLALKIAEPYLLAELATEGAGASRRNAGAFGRAVAEAPLALTLVWGAVLAAIAEELAFRGALFGAVEASAARVFGPADEVASSGRGRERWFSGCSATVASAVVFGAMHADMKGSVGIVRVVSTTCLGLACGTARLLSGTVVVAMIVHFAYNAVSLMLGRGLFRGDSEPLVSVVPNRLLALAASGALIALGIGVARRAFRGPA